ncbi:MAG: response regulator transcription factor [Burkholderiales bacterium]|nr:response regulator transcription factor [Burkholderiales bacterium]
MRILLVEDDAMLAEAVTRALTQSAHAVDCTSSGEEADRALTTEQYDLVLLDAGLPEIDGFEVLRRLRGRRSTVPVLMLTANDAPEAVVAGLDLGADDYLTKPFRLSELEARVRALIRRANASVTSEVVNGRLRLDMAGRRLYLDGRPMELSQRELAVIELLLLREGKVVTKQQIIDHLYGWDDVSSSNAVEVFIHRLRKKLENSGASITTVRGMGYLIEKANG